MMMEAEMTKEKIFFFRFFFLLSLRWNGFFLEFVCLFSFFLFWFIIIALSLLPPLYYPLLLLHYLLVFFWDFFLGKRQHDQSYLEMKRKKSGTEVPVRESVCVLYPSSKQTNHFRGVSFFNNVFLHLNEWYTHTLITTLNNGFKNNIKRETH